MKHIVNQRLIVPTARIELGPSSCQRIQQNDHLETFHMLLHPIHPAFFASLAIALLLSGCGGQRHNRMEISGLLTLDGQPLPSGLVVKFTPDDPGEPVTLETTDLESR